VAVAAVAAVAAVPPLPLRPSEEQQRILDHVAAGRNVVGDCVAGSGKTTSVLLLAQQFPEKRIVQVTYNAQLKLEVRQKAAALGFSHLEVHTYNSLCVRHYDREGYNNSVLRTVVERNKAPITPLPRVDLLVLDETQDMTHLFYRLLKKYIADNRATVPQMVVLGDRYQGIYAFMGADTRFLTLTNSLWGRTLCPQRSPPPIVSRIQWPPS